MSLSDLVRTRCLETLGTLDLEEVPGKPKALRTLSRKMRPLGATRCL